MTVNDLKLIGHVILTIDDPKFYEKLQSLLPKGYRFSYDLKHTEHVMDVKEFQLRYDIRSNFKHWITRYFKSSTIVKEIIKHYNLQWNEYSKKFGDLAYIYKPFNIIYKPGSNKFEGTISYNLKTVYEIAIVEEKLLPSIYGYGMYSYKDVIRTEIPVDVVLKNKKKYADMKLDLKSDMFENLIIAEFFPNIDSKTLDPESDTFIDQLIKLESEVNSAPNPKV